MFGDIEEILDDVEKKFKELKKFYVINSPRDYRWSRARSLLFCSSEKYHEFYKKIEKEWILLEEKLPNSIFVRAYEDTMRAVIINPPDAPFYPNGLFFFDILLTPNYPSAPPNIKYIDDDSLDMTLDLDAIIRKWKNNSSILDVLVEIKDELFNAKPYSNDGLISYIIPESSKSKLQSEVKHIKKAMLLNHQGMMNRLKSPPNDFEVFVKGYYRTRAHVILLNYKNRLDEVGADDELVLLFVGLIEAFERNGTYCKHHLVHLDNLFKKEAVQEERHQKEGFYMRAIAKLKTIYLD